jgi:hypothetical protein
MHLRLGYRGRRPKSAGCVHSPANPRFFHYRHTRATYKIVEQRGTRKREKSRCPRADSVPRTFNILMISLLSSALLPHMNVLRRPGMCFSPPRPLRPLFPLLDLLFRLRVCVVRHTRVSEFARSDTVNSDRRRPSFAANDR